jgi:hypothetical protein
LRFDGIGERILGLAGRIFRGKRSIPERVVEVSYKRSEGVILAH